MHGGALLESGCCEFAATGSEACLWLLTFADVLCNMLTVSVQRVRTTVPVKTLTVYLMSSKSYSCVAQHAYNSYAKLPLPVKH